METIILIVYLAVLSIKLILSAKLCRGTGYSSDLLLQNIQSASQISPVASFSNPYKYAAIFSRLNYSWNQKYIINLTFRRDGSSRFGPENQFNNFGSIGGAWIFSEEKIVQNNLTFLSFGEDSRQLRNYGK